MEGVLETAEACFWSCICRSAAARFISLCCLANRSAAVVVEVAVVVAEAPGAPLLVLLWAEEVRLELLPARPNPLKKVPMKPPLPLEAAVEVAAIF